MTRVIKHYATLKETIGSGSTGLQPSRPTPSGPKNRKIPQRTAECQECLEPILEGETFCDVCVIESKGPISGNIQGSSV